MELNVLGRRVDIIIRGTNCDQCVSEPVWPGGKALGWQAEGPRFVTPLRLSFRFKKVVVCGHCLVTLSITSY